MKKTYCAQAFLLLIALFLSTAAASCTAPERDALYINAQSQILYDKIEELSLAKSAAKQYLTRFSVPFEDAMADPDFAALHQKAEALREELLAMAARPSEETLAELFFSEDDTQNHGMDPDEFIALCGSAYDMWGVCQQVNTSFGSYSVYNLLVQDYAYGDLLSTHITQNGLPGYELFAANTPGLQDIAVRSMEEISLEGNIRTQTDAVEEVPAEGSIPAAQKTAAESADNAVTAAGNTKSYRIFCHAASCMSFVFVKDAPEGTWRHTLTTNYTAITETHDWLTVVKQNGKPTAQSGESTSQYTKYPQQYEYRYADAITAYRDGIPLRTNLAIAYDVTMRTPTSAAGVFSLEINCPTTKDQLYKSAQ